jgi:GAF domain-containing protein
VVGLALREVLCGAVRQGGRYLGMIELANPLGGAPFHETEINALDYICEQFADFVASRPVVLDPDVILGR